MVGATSGSEHRSNNGMTFTDELWQSIETIYASILAPI
jgi:hypothetical protein